jgi:uncharacterized protein YjfI (DUF2170 family)
MLPDLSATVTHPSTIPLTGSTSTNASWPLHQSSNRINFNQCFLTCQSLLPSLHNSSDRINFNQWFLTCQSLLPSLHNSSDRINFNQCFLTPPPFLSSEH